MVIGIKQPVLSGYSVFISPFNLRSSPIEVTWTLDYIWEPPTHRHTPTHANRHIQ